MVTAVTNDIQSHKEDIIRKIRSLDPLINIIETENSAGICIKADSIDENIPIIYLIINTVNNDITIRMEVIGNITQYIVDEAITNILRMFNLMYLEVTDPKTGLVKFSLYQKERLDANLYQIYKNELFNFHYAREDGRLVLFFDQGNLWISPKSAILPTTTKKPRIKPKLLTKKQIIKPKEVEIVHKEEIPDADTITKDYVDEKIKEPIKSKKSSKILVDLSQREQSVFKLVESRPNKKVQSKGLRKELPSMDQDTIRNILRSLVAKGLLYVRSAWYIVKDDPAEDTWDISSDTPIEERLKSLSPKEKKIYDILDNRAGNKAQARMLVKETKMTKDNLKKLLRNMVAKDVLFVYAAWYCIKE